MSLSKKIATASFSLIAAICMAAALFLLPAKATHAATVTLSDRNEFTWSEEDPNALTGLSDAGKTHVGASDFVVVLPAGVTAIGDNAFANMSALKSINLDEAESLLTIGDNAFSGCSGLQTVTIPKSVTTVGLNAFYNCYGLNEINYYAESASVQYHVFELESSRYATSKVTVNIGGDGAPVNKLPSGLFCRVTTGEDDVVTSVSGHRGIYAVNFNNVTLDGGEQETGWGYNVFRGCTSLATVSFTDCSIPLINRYAFADCSLLNSVTGLDDMGLQTIKTGAFKNCSSLFSIKLGSEVATIEGGENVEYAFDGCDRLVEVINLSSTITLEKKSGNHGKIAAYAIEVYNKDDGVTETKIESDIETGDFRFIKDSSNTVYLLGYTGTDLQVTLPSEKHKGYQIYNKAFYRNTTVTRIIVPSASVVRTVGESAFADCTALTRVDFQSDIMGLGSKAFQNCKSLTSVLFTGNAPQNIDTATFAGCTSLNIINLTGTKTIGYQAFMNCTSLKNVNFGTVKVNDEDVYTITSIEGSAFAGCVGLEVIRIPSTVTLIDTEAFKGCSKLGAVYLPENARYGTAVFDGCADGLLLISANKEQYTTNSAKDTLKNYSDNLTYIIELELYYNDGVAIGGKHTVDKLYKRDGGLTKNPTDYSWSQTSSMPQQTGYAVSIWFDGDNYANQIDLEALTLMLGEERESIQLHARYIQKPALTAKIGSDAKIYEEGLSYGMKQILENCFKLDGSPILDAQLKEDIFRYDITSHYYADGNKDSTWNWGAVQKITEAGTYTLFIELQPDVYGKWMSDIEISFEIKPKEVSIDNLISWGTEQGSLNTELEKLYFYGSVPYIEEQENENLTRERYVLNSYAVYTGDIIEILLDEDLFALYGTVEKYDGNRKSAPGTHTAKAIIVASNNYKLTYVGQSETMAQQGLSFSMEGGNLVVTKIWYIAKSSANHLMFEGEGGKPSSMYEIKVDKDGIAWNYRGTNVLDRLPQRPTLSADWENVLKLVTFKLELDGKQMVKEKDGEKLDKWQNYFNSSMPSGKYVLTLFVADTTVDGVLVAGTGVDENGNKVGKSYEFTVGKATLPRDQKDTSQVFAKVAENGTLTQGVVDVPFNGKLAFAPTERTQGTNTHQIYVLYNSMQVERGGVWADKEYDSYFEEFEIVYSVKEGAMKNYVNDPAPSVYYSEDDYLNKEAEGAYPNLAGTYTVFYKISAPNYSDEIIGRYELNLFITIQEDKIYVGNIDFTGKTVIGEVLLRLEDKINHYYDIYTLRNEDIGTKETTLITKYGEDTYINMGTHKVFVKIKDSVSSYVRWSSSVPKDQFVSGTALNDLSFRMIEFNIVASSGLEVIHLSVNEWEYGSFTSDNAPKWLLQIYEDYNNYEFVLYSENNEEYYYYADSSKLEGKKGFNEAPAGKYTLTAYAIDNGNRVVESSIEIEIAKATPVLATVPYVDSWNYGSYVDGLIKPVYSFVYNNAALSAPGKVSVKYCTETEYNLPNRKLSNIGDLLNSAGQLPVGTYYLVLVVEGDANFNAWSYGVRFRVMNALNYDWTYGDYSKGKAIDASQFGNNVTIQYKNAAEVGDKWYDSVEKIPDFIANADGELPVGVYQFQVFGNGGVKIYEGSFNVTKAVNSWATVPSIIGWVQGSYSASANKPQAVAKFGNGAISYAISDENGNSYTLENANSLAAGKYSLTVTVAGSDNWEELSTVVYFVVAEASGSGVVVTEEEDVTTLAVILIAVSAIVVILAAVGIVLLMLYSKKLPKSHKPAKKATGRK